MSPGDYIVNASGPAATPAGIAEADGTRVYAPTYFPGVLTPDTATRVHVDAGRETAISFPLVVTARTRITGFVRTSNGAVSPRPHAALLRTTGWGNGFLTSGQSVEVGHDGSFFVVDLVPGDYVLVVTTETDDDESAEQARVPITATGSNVDGLVVTTGRGGAMRGRFVYEGRPNGAHPEPPNFFVSSVESPAADLFSTHRESWNPDDTFEISGLFGRGVVRLADHDGWILKAVLVDGRDVIDAPFDFRNGGDVNGVQVVVTTKSSAVTGTAADASGPTADFTAVLFPEDRPLRTPYSRFIASTQPDRSGRFGIRGLPAGRYLIAAVDELEPGAAFDPDLLERLEAHATPVVLGEGESQEMTLKVIGR